MPKHDKFVKVYRVCKHCKGTKYYLKKKYIGSHYVENEESCDYCDSEGMEFAGYEKV